MYNYRKTHVNEIKIRNKEYRKNNKLAVEERVKKWCINNKERVKLLKKRYREKNIEKIKLINKKYREKNKKLIKLRHKLKYNNDFTYHLSYNISHAIYKSLKDGKQGRHWEDIVGYTINDLIKHLESRFTEGMTWNNYGDWHIDHIKPQVLFKFNSYEDKEFKECWSLSNLQPLWAEENFSKNDKYEMEDKRIYFRELNPYVDINTGE